MDKEPKKSQRTNQSRVVKTKLIIIRENNHVMALEVVKPTNEALEVRRGHLSNYIHEQLDARLMPTNKQLLAFMRESYPEYTIDQLFKDKKQLQLKENFVSELSITSYSYYLKEIWDKIEVVEREAFKDFDNNSGFVRINAKKIILDAQKLRSDLISNNIDLSVEKLGKKLRELTQDNQKLRDQYEKERKKNILKSKS